MQRADDLPTDIEKTGSVEGDVAVLRAHVQGTKIGIYEVKDDIADTREEVREVDHKVGTLIEQIGGLSAQIAVIISHEYVKRLESVERKVTGWSLMLKGIVLLSTTIAGIVGFLVLISPYIHIERVAP